MLRTRTESEAERHYSRPSYTVPPVPAVASDWERACVAAARLRANGLTEPKTEEIEDAALENGIEPRLVREALTALQTPDHNVPATVVTTVYQTEPLPTSEQVTKEMRLMFGIPLAFAVGFALLTTGFVQVLGRGSFSQNPTFGALWLLSAALLPVAVTLFLGMNLRKKRQGAVAGFLMGIGVGVTCGVLTDTNEAIVSGIAMGFLCGGLGAFIGAAGTALGNSLYGSERRN